MRVSANLDEDGNPLGRDTTFGMREKMLKDKQERNTDSFWARLSRVPSSVPNIHHLGSRRCNDGAPSRLHATNTASTLSQLIRLTTV